MIASGPDAFRSGLEAIAANGTYRKQLWRDWSMIDIRATCDLSCIYVRLRHNDYLGTDSSALYLIMLVPGLVSTTLQLTLLILLNLLQENFSLGNGETIVFHISCFADAFPDTAFPCRIDGFFLSSLTFYYFLEDRDENAFRA